MRISLLVSLIVLGWGANAFAGGFGAFMKGFSQGGATIVNDPYYKSKELGKQADQQQQQYQMQVNARNSTADALREAKENYKALWTQYEAAK